VVDLHESVAAPLLDIDRLSPSSREPQRWSDQHQASNFRMTGGVERGEVTAQARADQSHRIAGGQGFDDFELAGDGEVFEISAGEVGDLKLRDSGPKKGGFLRGWAGGKAMQVNDARHGAIVAAEVVRLAKRLILEHKINLALAIAPLGSFWYSSQVAAKGECCRDVPGKLPGTENGGSLDGIARKGNKTRREPSRWAEYGLPGSSFRL
jgi:hypothetical protein